MNEYMTDEELLKLINDVESSDIVKAPPEMVDKVFNKIDKKNQLIEYKRFRNRVIASVAAIIVVTMFTFENPLFIKENMHIYSIETEDIQLSVNFRNSHYIRDFFNESEE